MVIYISTFKVILCIARRLVETFLPSVNKDISKHFSIVSGKSKETMCLCLKVTHYDLR